MSNTSEPAVIDVIAANLRELRAARARSLSELARVSGVGKATLSALEGGRGNPTMETLSALATALDVPFGELITARPQTMVAVVRADEGTTVPGTTHDLRLISRLPTTASVELYEASFKASQQRSSGAHGPGTREHVLVTRGTLRVGPPGHEVGLRPGDYAAFDADVPHLYAAGGRGARAILLMQWAS